MKTRRFWEFGLVLVLCGIGAWWSQSRHPVSSGNPDTASTPVSSPGPSLSSSAWMRSKLRTIIYNDRPFHYSTTLNQDGTAVFSASFACVAATPEPGVLGCQHLDGKLSRPEVEALWRFFESEAAGFTFLGEREELHNLEFGFEEMPCWTSNPKILARLETLHPGGVRKRLLQERAGEERALTTAP